MNKAPGHHKQHCLLVFKIKDLLASYDQSLLAFVMEENSLKRSKPTGIQDGSKLGQMAFTMATSQARGNDNSPVINQEKPAMKEQNQVTQNITMVCTNWHTQEAAK